MVKLLRSRYLAAALVLTCTVVQSRQGFAQSCPPPDPNCPWSVVSYTYETTKVGIAYLDCSMRITYKERVCNGVREYYFESIDAFGMCEGLGDFENAHFDYSAKLDFAIMRFLYDEATTGPWSGQGTPPTVLDCSATGPANYANVYTAACGIEVGCEYTVNPASRQCSQGFDEPYPDYIGGTDIKVKYTRWQSCGSTCCKRTFRLCWKSSLGDPNIRILSAELVQKIKLTECSEQQSKYLGQPCNEGC